MTDNQLLTEAFRTIASIVREFETQGRVCRGATLKPEYLRRVPLLAERALGFRKFGDLLRAAANAGYIRLTARTGVDLEATLPAAGMESVVATQQQIFPEETVNAVESADIAGAIRVRPDLWRAFNSNSVVYCYSRERDRAVPASLIDGRSPSPLRVPSLASQVKELMGDFVSAHLSELSSDLAHQLTTARHRYDFEMALRANTLLLKKWRADYIKYVVAQIQSWASQNKLTLHNLIGSFRGSLPDGSTAGGARDGMSVPSPESRLVDAQVSLADELDRRCASLLDTLIGELLELRGLLSVAHSKRA